jgi:hypothetical protein
MTGKNYISYKMTIVIRNSHTSRNAQIQTQIFAFDLTISIFLSIELKFIDEQVKYCLEY